MIESNQPESAGSGALPAAVLTSAFLKGAEIWMKAQGETLSAMEAVMADWLRRRHEAFDTWSRSFKKMCECRDPVDFVQTQQDWLCEAIRLTALEIRALVGDTAILSTKPTAEIEKTVTIPDDNLLRTRRGRPESGGSQPMERVAAE